MSILDQLQGKKFDSVDQQTSAEYIRCNFYNEQPRRARSLGAGGFFFISKKALFDPPTAPWVLEELQFRTGKDRGYVNQHIKAAVLGYRKCYTRGDGDTYERLFERQRPKDAKSRLEVLALVEGVPEPVVLVFKTYSAGNIEAFLTRTYPRFLKGASKKAGVDLPMWLFWIPIGPQVDEHGEVVHLDTEKGAVVTPAMVHWPKGTTDEIADLLGLPVDLRDLAEEEIEAAQEWVHEWDPQTLRGRGDDDQATDPVQPDVSTSPSGQENARTNTQTADPSDIPF